MSESCLGIARARLGPAASVIRPPDGIAACEENRLTRAQAAPTAGPPALAIAELRAFLKASDEPMSRVAVVRDDDQPEWYRADRAIPLPADVQTVDAHRAHAEYAFVSSGFDDALIVVCDAASAAGWSAWRGEKGRLLAQYQASGDLPIARVYTAMTAALGLRPSRDEHLVESMARAGVGQIGDAPVIPETDLRNPDAVQRAVEKHVAAAADKEEGRRAIAASVQRQLGEALAALLGRLARETRSTRLCLSGGLFFNTHFTTVAAHCGAFEDVFIPPHPGRNGSAVGAALVANQGAAVPVDVRSPYLGPGFGDAQVKAALENCKLSYDLQREDKVVETVLRAISRGRLVGWFHGRLEWGPRALGHRTVLADPFGAHVLENMNGYLKQRPWYRSYGVSVPAARLAEFFEVPRGSVAAPGSPRLSPFMQYEYRPRDLAKFRTILPPGVETIRVHTVDESEPRYLRLLEAWGEMSGVPVVVNTSFNGFHEPLVCSPRDAIRVFYGTGLDLLALEDFILRK